MPRPIQAPKRDRAGTFRVEVHASGVTKIYAYAPDGTSTYEERPWEIWQVAIEGESEIRAHSYARRRRREGLTVRVISHEAHLAEVAEEKRARRSESAKWGWETRRERAERKRKKAFPGLKVVADASDAARGSK